MTHVRFANVVKEFGAERALADFSLEVDSGELLSILGPSGSGKTTALRILAGFETPDAGEIHIGGQEVSQMKPQSRNLGMVFQSYSLFPNMTVIDNIMFALKMRKWAKEDIPPRVEELVDMVRLTKHRHKYPHQLSGGQQQRVALARAMATNPPLLLLDEPLSALDQAVRERLRVDIRNVQQTLGVTTIFVTHDQHEAMAMSDRIAVMNEGKLVQLGTPLEVYSSPNSQFCANFMGQMNSLPLEKKGSHWTLFGVNVGLTADGESAVAFVRPENIAVVADPRGKGTITDVAFLGSITRITVAINGTTLVAEVPTPSTLDLARGRTVSITPDFSSSLIEANG